MNRLVLLLASVIVAGCTRNSDCDVPGIPYSPFLACSELPPIETEATCGGPPASRLYTLSAGSADAGSEGYCSASHLCGPQCTIRDPSRPGEFLPSECVRATENANRTFTLDPAGALGVCAVSCSDPAFICAAPATCVDAADVYTGETVPICVLPW